MTRLRVGVIGLGAIAQIHHLPQLEQRSDRFEIGHVCDLSPALAEALASRFSVPRHSVDWRRVCEDPDLDAVLLLNSGSHGRQARAALENGLHVLAEKPLCYTEREADELQTTLATGDLILQVGYMKSHEAVMELARAEVERLADLRLVRHAVFHPSEVAQQQHLRLLRFGDVPPETLSAEVAQNERLVSEAIGVAPAGLGWLYSELGLGSIVHYLAVFRSLLGRLPERIVSAHAWPFDIELPPAGWGPDDQLPTLSVFASFGGECRLELTWSWLQRYPEYTEIVEVYSPDGAVHLHLPPPYVHHRSARMLSEHVGADGLRHASAVSGGYNVAFGRELDDFYAAVVESAPVVSSVAEARDDVHWCQALTKAVAAGLGLALEGVR